MPFTRDDAIGALLRSERRFRMRIAFHVDDEARADLASALRKYAAEIIAIDHSKAVAFLELAETVDTAYPRTFS